ncbi:putative protein kinase [Trypanosoma conorhini]|uniref:Protein kinase domain-containing protein n=1 Tax=Trypanosoma conorhini TaxID=83891 RepID=A0A3R7MF57_9TRYP|nr:putative protein kinase [Trypanosoma conorhini]RNF14065.1 putative protein kinase [Trypanosoma conorhini]
MRAGAGGAPPQGDGGLRALLSPCLSDAFCSLDVAAVERVLVGAVADLRRGEARQWGDGALESACRSLLCAYVVGLRLAVGAFAPEEEDAPRSAWRALLKITACTGRAVAEMCAVPGAAAATAGAVVQVLSALLRPPSPARETRLFWRCYPWWCCLLRHCLALAVGEGAGGAGMEAAACGVAARALSWVSRRYAAEAAGRGVVFDVSVFLSALGTGGGDAAATARPVHAFTRAERRRGATDEEDEEEEANPCDLLAAELGSLFALQELHTLLPLRPPPDAAAVRRGGNEAALPPTQNEPHCDACGLVELQFSPRGTAAARRTPVAHALLLLLCAVPSRPPLPSPLSAPLRRCLAEQSAAAALAALLRRDADVADALLSALARLGEGAGFIYFLALWRAAFAAAATEVSETMAWLLAGLARGVETHLQQGGDGGGAGGFLAAVDAVFAGVVRVVAGLLRASATADEGNAACRLRDLCARGFVEAWDALLRAAAPLHCGRTLGGLFCDAVGGGHASAVQLRGPLEAYYAAVLERRWAVGGECMGAAPAASAWWPEAEGRADAQGHALRVLRHTLALSECAFHADRVCPPPRGEARRCRHPAAFFLRGTTGLCARLLSTPPPAEAAAQAQLGELQCVASEILTVAARTLCTSPGRELFASPFGNSPGRHATTYARLLYVCFLERLRQTPRPEQRCLRALLRALRSLVIWERAAHSLALRLSMPSMLSCMLPAGADGWPLTAPAKAPVRGRLLTSAATPSDASPQAASGNNRGRKEEGAAARPIIPTLSLAALPLPQYYAWMGEADAAVDAGSSSAQAPPVPPLKLAPHSQQPHSGDGVPAVTQGPREEAMWSALDDPATLAEVLLLLCCLLSGRTGGMMISQPGLVAAHWQTGTQPRQPQGERVRGNVPLTRVLRKIEAFVRCPANKAPLHAFDKLVAEEAQEESPLWTGVEVLRRLLLPQLRLLEGINVARRIGAGSYGAVYAAERSAATASSGPQATQPADGAELLALKMVSIARPDMGGECLPLLSCHSEATALLRLRGHPHICELRFFGCTEAHYVLAMPLYKGGSLRDWRVRRSGLPVGEPAAEAASDSPPPAPAADLLAVCGPVFAQVLAAVEFMHARGIRHNDLKADNILIEGFQGESPSHAALPQAAAEAEAGRCVLIPATIRICDFGVCELAGEDMLAVRRGSEATDAAAASCWGPVRGTEAVQAPETFSLAGIAPARPGSCRAAVELAADMWGCGCLLYELVTGVMLFGGGNLGRLLFLAANLRRGGRGSCEVLSPQQKRAFEMAGPGVAAFAAQLLSVDPAERPTAAAARQAWERVLLQAQAGRGVGRDGQK